MESHFSFDTFPTIVNFGYVKKQIEIQPVQNLCRRQSSDRRTALTGNRHRDCCSKMTELICDSSAVFGIEVINSPTGVQSPKMAFIRPNAIVYVLSQNDNRTPNKFIYSIFM